MGNGISSVGGPPPIIPNQQGGQPQAITNPTAQQLLELMAERPLVQQLQGQTAQGGAFITLGNQQGTDLNVQFVPQGTPLPAQPDVALHNVQAVATDGHAVIDPQTNYVLTDPFTGCSFFMLAINGQDTVFHVQEQMPGQPLLTRLAPFMTVADAIRAQHPDQTLTPLVDAYLDQHPHQEVTDLKGQDPQQYLRSGLALMVMENLQTVAGYAFTETVYTQGNDYQTVAQGVGDGRIRAGSAMLVREQGQWMMLEQTIDTGSTENPIMEHTVPRGGLHVLLPPDLLTALQGLAGVQPPPVGTGQFV